MSKDRTKDGPSSVDDYRWRVTVRNNVTGLLREYRVAATLIALAFCVMVTAVVAFPDSFAGPFLFLAGYGIAVSGFINFAIRELGTLQKRCGTAGHRPSRALIRGDGRCPGMPHRCINPGEGTPCFVTRLSAAPTLSRTCGSSVCS
jgi:hypothetical protein